MSQATLDAPATPVTSSASPRPRVGSPHVPASGDSPVNGNPLPIHYAIRKTTASKQGINSRLVLFIAVVALPLAAVSWLMLRGMLNKGITWHGDYAEVDLKALGNFPFDGQHGTRDDVPARWRALDGKKVELKGYMFNPLSAGAQGNEFQFVYNVNRCCLGGPPQVQERVYAHSRADLPIFPVYVLAKVVGILHVRIDHDDAGGIHSVFDLDVQHIEDLGG